MDPRQEAARNSALDQFRASRGGQYQSSSARSYAPNASNGYSPYQQAYTPPTQSRDASSGAQWANSHNTYGNVLVPSSSPLGPEPRQLPHHQPHPPHMFGNSFTMPGMAPAQSNAWRPTNNTPLAAQRSFGVSSGFQQGSHALNASGTRQTPVNGWNDHPQTQNGGYTQGTKRPRLDDHASKPQRPESPPSPDVQRPGQRRRPNLATDSSDDSFDAGSAGGRLSRGRPPTDAEQYSRFRLTQPGQPEARVKAAWTETKGDSRAASGLLLNESWQPKVAKPAPAPVSSPTRPTPAPAPTSQEETGRVKEVDDASQAARIAARERGKKSAIYQNRPVVDTVKPAPVTKPAAPAKRASPPPSPIIRGAGRKRAKKVIDSDSDEGYEASDDDGPQGRRAADDDDDDDVNEARALSYLNTAGPDAIQELTGCTSAQANKILELRPFDTVDELNAKLQQGKKKAGPAGISSRMFSDCVEIFSGYGSVDSVLNDCEEIGAQLRTTISSWVATEQGTEDGALNLGALSAPTNTLSKDCIVVQPALLSSNIKLKDYQLSGVSWLRLLYRKKLSCILADEMGLGKTAQVISFFASLKEQGIKGPHLVVVPASTLENWIREFNRFAPDISVQTYYASKGDRPVLRETLLETIGSKHDGGWEVLVTSYTLAAQGDEKDRKFFRRIDWNCCVFDEGHALKNYQSQRYQTLLKYDARWRLLLTGTPLQNNLQELVSLMNFILPDRFADSLDSLRAIFKVKGDQKVSLLAQERVSRAKKMMTPFVLRRRKDQVLTDLPKKLERIEWCEMTPLQKSIYRDTMQRSRKTVMEVIAADPLEDDLPPEPKSKAAKKKAPTKKERKMYLENSSNVLMDLRKASLHPALFRRRYTNDMLADITRVLLKEPDYKKRGAVYQYCYEDMGVMTDSELQLFLSGYKSTKKFLHDPDMYFDAGKVQMLMRLLGDYLSQGRKILIFSQFTQVLDILVRVLDIRGHKYLMLTGTTPVDTRQALVDEFSEDESIPIFLLSTKAGGMGINLTAASVVIMFDQDFNPHNDRQAQDRAYRIGQKRDVDVVKLVTKGTIEEDMLRLGLTKLALDEAVAGDNEDTGTESEAAKQMRTGLMKSLRQHFEEEEDGMQVDKVDEDAKMEE